MQAASGPGDGAAAAQPAARDAVGVPASRTDTTGGALASGEGCDPETIARRSCSIDEICCLRNYRPPRPIPTG